MRTVLILFRKDFIHFFRNKAAVLLTFIVPFALIYLFGQIFGINQDDRGPLSIPIAVVNESSNPAAAKLAEALQEEKSLRVLTAEVNPDQSELPLTEERVRAMMKETNPQFRFALVIPTDLIREDALGMQLKILSNPRNEIETQTVSGLLQKVIYSNVPELLGQTLQARARQSIGSGATQAFNQQIAHAVASSFGGDVDQISKSINEGNFGFDQSGSTDAADDDETAPADFISQLITIDSVQVVGADVKSPAATRLVGGWAIQFLLFALSASATSLFRERDAGIFQRLLASPVSRAQILWSKFCFGLCIGLTQLVVLFMAGNLLFGIEVLPHLPMLIIVCLFAASTCTAFGMLLAAISPNAEAAGGLATFLILLMSALGGAWFPVSIMPEFIQHFSKLTLVYWSMEGFSSVLWADHSLVQILPILGILGAITLGVMAVAIWRFNKGRLFG